MTDDLRKNQTDSSHSSFTSTGQEAERKQQTEAEESSSAPMLPAYENSKNIKKRKRNNKEVNKEGREVVLERSSSDSDKRLKSSSFSSKK